MPIEPGALCDTELPCDARFDEKWCRLMAPANPLPIVTPVTSTFCPTANRSTPSVAPAFTASECSAASVVGLTRNSRSAEPPSTPALAKCPAAGLLMRDALRTPWVSWTAAYPSMAIVLIWVTRLLPTSSTVTGTDSPSSLKMRVMPTLRPSKPRPDLRAAGTGAADAAASGLAGAFISAIFFSVARLRLAGAHLKEPKYPGQQRPPLPEPKSL